jgi:phospholipase/carboxylesterase
MLSYLEIPSVEKERGVMIWLHGLGASGSDLEPVAEMLGIPGLRHILPDAPVRAVTLNGGMRMRAWYDLTESDFYGGRGDEAGLLASADAIAELVGHTVPLAQALFVAGFSQGGAVALAVALQRLKEVAGIIVMSSYFPKFLNLGDCGQSSVFMAHGTHDPVVLPDWGRASRSRLEAAGFPVTWREYPMAHSICLEEIQDIATWVGQRLQR